MCGIVGFINADHMTAFGDKARLVFEQLLWHSTQRGWEGTGVLAINGSPDNYQPTVFKNAMWAPDYLQTHTYRQMLQKRLNYSRVAIGHNRATTKGSVRHENAHPFEHKHITLVQNGMINSHNSHLPGSMTHEVDSYAAAYLMGEKGEKEALEALDFAGVFVWWNSKDGTLNMARNEHRELFCVPIKGQNAMFYASEWEMLHWILTRNNVEPEGKYLSLTPGVHFKFDPTKPKEWQKTPFVDAQSQPRSMRGYRGKDSGAPAGGGTGNQPGTGTSGTQATTYNVNGDNDSVRPKRADQVTDAECNWIEHQYERLSSKERKKYGIPDSRHKLKKVVAKIENTGIPQARFGAQFIVYPNGWAPYKNQKNLGVISGSKRADATVLVEIPNTTQKEFDTLAADKYGFATVVNAKKNGQGKWLLVMALIPNKQDNFSDLKAAVKTHTKTDGSQATLIKGPRGSYIELAKFQAMIQGGCAYCTGSIQPKEAETVVWFGEEPICESCSTNPTIAEELGFNATRKAVH
jgi:hypothetical protein